MITRGAIHWTDLGEPVAGDHRPAKRRPVLVVQADTLLASNLATVAVVSLTSNLAAAKMPGNVLLPAEETGLPRDSVVNVTQLTTLNRYELENPPVGVLAAHLMHDVDAGLALALGLPPWQTRY